MWSWQIRCSPWMLFRFTVWDQSLRFFQRLFGGAFMKDKWISAQHILIPAVELVSGSGDRASGVFIWLVRFYITFPHRLHASQANLIWDISLHCANQTVKWAVFQCSVNTKSVLWNAHRSLRSTVLFMYENDSWVLLVSESPSFGNLASD